MKKILSLAVLFCVSSVFGIDESSRKPQMEYIDNGIIRIGAEQYVV